MVRPKIMHLHSHSSTNNYHSSHIQASINSMQLHKTNTASFSNQWCIQVSSSSLKWSISK
jgi:hypothetical protein